MGIFTLVVMVVWLGVAILFWVTDHRVEPANYFLAVLSWSVAMMPTLFKYFGG